MTTSLLFLDTETTGLSLDDDIWEFAAIRRKPDGSQSEHQFFIEHDKAKCAQLPDAFRADHEARWPADGVYASRHIAAGLIAALMADRPHIVGAVPNFDTERLARLLAEFDHKPGWHYHLIDVEAMAVGWLNAKPINPLTPPWDSDELSRAVGIEPPGEGERHTAMGDARWAMRLYDRITGGKPPDPTLADLDAEAEHTERILNETPDPI